MTGAPRRVLAGCAATLAAFALCACGVKREAVLTPPTKPYAVMLDGQPSAEHAALYTALAHGQLRAGGLDVTLEPPSGPAKPLAALEDGQVDMAVASQSELLEARDRGESLVAVGSLDPAGGDVPVLVVREHDAVHGGEDLRAFLYGLDQGASAAHAEPGASAALLVRANPALLGGAGKAAQKRRLKALEAAIATATTTREGKPYGYQDPTAWSTLAATMYGRRELHTDPGALAPPYTNEYLPGQGI